MKKLLLVIVVCLASAAFAQMPQIGNPIDRGPVLPATCYIGQGLFFKTSATTGVYACTVTNTWLNLTGGGGGGGDTITSPGGTITVGGTSSNTTLDIANGALPAGVTLAWNQNTNPAGNLALSIGAFSTHLIAGAATSTNSMFEVIDTAGNTGTGPMGDFEVTSSSAAFPLKVKTPNVTFSFNNDDSFSATGGSVSTAWLFTGITSGLIQTLTVPDSTAGGTATLPGGTYNILGDAITNTLTGLLDVSGGTIKVPAGAGSVSTAANNMVIDTTGHNLRCWNGSVDGVCITMAATPVDGAVAYISKSGGSSYKLTGSSVTTTFWGPQYNVATAEAGSTANKVSMWGFIAGATVSFTKVALGGATVDAGGHYSWGITDLTGATICSPAAAVAMTGAHSKIDITCQEASPVIKIGQPYIFYYTGDAITGQIYGANNNSIIPYYDDSTNSSTTGLPTFPLTVAAIGPRQSVVAMPQFFVH